MKNFRLPTNVLLLLWAVVALMAWGSPRWNVGWVNLAYPYVFLMVFGLSMYNLYLRLRGRMRNE